MKTSFMRYQLRKILNNKHHRAVVDLGFWNVVNLNLGIWNPDDAYGR